MLSAVYSWLSRYFSLVVLASILAIVVARLIPTEQPELRWDSVGYHLWTYALIEGDLNFERYRNCYGYIGLYPTRDGAWFHNKYPPGVALIRLPVMAFLVGDDITTNGISRKEGIAALILGALALWGTGFFALRSCRHVCAAGWTPHLAVLAGFFGTGLFFYCTVDSGYSHVWSALGFSILVDRYLASCANPESKPVGVDSVLITLLLVLIRNSNVLAIVFLSLSFAAWRSRRGMVWKRSLFYAMLGGGMGLAIHIALNSYAHGRLVFSSYADEEFLWHRPMHDSVLFSSQQGLFPYAPLFGIVLLAGWSIRVTRSATTAYAVLMASYVFVYGYWHCWNLGGGVGHRGFVEISPLLIPLFAGCLAYASRPVLQCFLAATILGIWISQSFAVACFRGTYPWSTQSRDTYVENLIGEHALWRY